MWLARVPGLTFLADDAKAGVRIGKIGYLFDPAEPRVRAPSEPTLHQNLRLHSQDCA